MILDIDMMLLGVLAVFGLTSVILLFMIYFQNKDVLVVLDFMLRKK